MSVIYKAPVFSILNGTLSLQLLPALLLYFLRHTCLVYSGLTNGLNPVLAHACHQPETPAHADIRAIDLPTFGCTLVYTCHPGFLLWGGSEHRMCNQTWNGQGSPLSVKVSHWWEVRVGPCRTDSCPGGRTPRSSLLEALSVIPPNPCLLCVSCVCVNMCAVCVGCRRGRSSGEMQISLFEDHILSQRERCYELEGK